MNGYLTVPFRAGPERINEDQAMRTRPIFGRFVSETVSSEFADCALVPVPSKDSCEGADFRSYKMIRESVPADLLPRIAPIVRFTEVRQAASQGGLRGYDAVFPYLVVDRGAEPGSVVLVDDIVTTGGTILATKKRLEDRGFTVRGAIVCGRTVAAPEKAFFPRSFELSENEGQIDF
jgi:hypothetical protein